MAAPVALHLVSYGPQEGSLFKFRAALFSRKIANMLKSTLSSNVKVSGGSAPDPALHKDVMGSSLTHTHSFHQVPWKPGRIRELFSVSLNMWAEPLSVCTSVHVLCTRLLANMHWQMHLTAPHFKINKPVGASALAI